MNAYERVTAALNHQPSDCIPVYPILSGANRRLVGAGYPAWSMDAAVCADSYLAAADRFDLDCIVTLIDLSVECDAWGQKIVYPENEAAHPDYSDLLLKDISELERLSPADWRNSRRMQMHLEVCRRITAGKKGKLPIIAFVFGPLGTLSMMRGQQALYMDLYDDPNAVMKALNAVGDTLAGYAAALCDTGVDAIMWDTLFASGSIMSKEMWRGTEGVVMKRLAQTVRDRGCLNMIHNCGCRVYFDAQIEAVQPAAISFLYPPDDCADFSECKQKYGAKTTLIGCVTPANAVMGTDAEWDEQCRTQIEAMGKGGGFILATGCEYPANAPFDRAQRMINLARATRMQ